MAGITPKPGITATAGHRSDTIAIMTGTGEHMHAMAGITTAMSRRTA
jgi:hypothetical protein